MQLNLENLNAAQISAVKKTTGPLLVLAGAGTGKTRVLTTRIGYILSQNLAKPWQILSLTFTNKAANEMKNRLDTMADGEFYARDIWCGTFHSMCLRILHSNYAAAGLRPDFLIYGEDDQKSVIKKVLADLNLQTTKKPADYVEDFSRIKDRGISEKPVTDKIFNAYNDELARMGAVDFGDIILRTLHLFQNNPGILEHYQNQFKYILVDEFQDTNAAQMQLLTFLTKHSDNPNICCVGDDDQSIYSWRGAEIKNILNFEKTFPGAKIIRLETNYRSTGNILGAANSLIRHNNDRLGKDLTTANANDMGEKVYVKTFETDSEEAESIANAIVQNGSIYNDTTILIRSGTLSRRFEKALDALHVSYRLIGDTKLYERMEIRDVIAYIRLLTHPFDDISFLRIIGKPRRGFGPSAIEKLRGFGDSLMSGLRNAKLKGKQAIAAKEFLSLFDFDWENMAPQDAVQKLLDDSGYIKMWKESGDIKAQERLIHIQELKSDIAECDSLNDFLEQAELRMEEDDNIHDDNVVNIMTIHAAKGAEFDTVFIPAVEENIFPNKKSINDGSIEEERRLMYVALTRAKKRVFITNAVSRLVYDDNGVQSRINTPSRFISEIDSKYLCFGNDIAPRQSPQQYSGYRVAKKIFKPKTENLVGRQARHSEYGTGVIIADGTGILTIAFGSRGIKKIARDFVTIL